MSCHPTESLLTLLAELAVMRRPCLLLRTARFGTQDYNRDTDLKRILRLPATPRPGSDSLRQLIELEARQEEARTRPPHEVGTPWRAARHVEVLIALMAEARLLVEPVPSVLSPLP